MAIYLEPEAKQGGIFAIWAAVSLVVVIAAGLWVAIPPPLYVVGPNGEAAVLEFAGPPVTYGRQCTTDADCLKHCGEQGEECIPAGWIEPRRLPR